jgi:cytoskeleton protein RodZ
MVQNAGLGVGALLRQRREELGQDIEAVSRQLRIRAIYIKAIEEGRLQDLPGTAYAVGFVRTYADFLGFDGNSVVADYRDELAQRTRTEPVSWRMEERESHFPGGKLLLACVVLAGLAYGGWYYLSNTPSGAGLIESVPDYLKKNSGGEGQSGTAGEAPKAGETASPTGDQAASSAAPQSEPAANAPATPDNATTGTAGSADEGASPAAPATDQSAGGTEENATAPQASDGAAGEGAAAGAESATGQPGSEPSTAETTESQPAEQPAASSEAGQTATPAESGTASPDVAAAAASTATRVNIHAKLESWVQIVDKDGKTILSRVLRAGETYAVPDEAGLVMSTGNAGGIEMLLDGKPLQNLGAVGLVRRNIPLDPEKLASGAAFLKTPSPAPASGGAGNSAD